MTSEDIKLLIRLEERQIAAAEDISEIKEALKVIHELPCGEHTSQISTLFRMVYFLMTIIVGQSIALLYEMIKG